jgi:hypothetical protein
MALKSKWPDTIFKYTKREFAEGMVTFGDVRVGNLKAYTDETKFGPEVADAGEGTAYTSELVGRSTPDAPTTGWVAEQALRQTLGVNARNAHIVGCRFGMRNTARNCFVYCTARHFNIHTLERLRQSDGYDTVVVIHDVLQFAAGVNRALCARVPDLRQPMTAYNCVYSGRNRTVHDERLYVGSLKEPRHQHQDEMRLAWPPPLAEELGQERFELVRSEDIANSCRILPSREYTKWQVDFDTAGFIDPSRKRKGSAH